MEKQELLYEGKAKRLYKTDGQDQLWVEYKDALTAFNGEKKEEKIGKGRLNNEISSLLFQKLTEAGIANHFLKRLSETEQLVKATTIVPIEVVVRNVAAGSLAKRVGLPEGEPLNRTVVEFYFKDDALGDPLINEDHIALLELATKEQLKAMREIALEVNEVLQKQFRICDVLLIDFKLEFGLDEQGEILLADEVSPDTCRLWDAYSKEKFDKDVFRQSIGDVETAYETILHRLKEADQKGVGNRG
ncbi:phosphoribosylaminoimidazolesuccinocarboxamide synthase [Halalkalibacillus halophilus]|uniref:phosphoribosylaminoimidazolesuccinocarboxamide synthase n=1 Tax=Halalkalibacillus halophilus TaxID=392827 RepID=UPI0003F8C956|nr:phosphoribosylaminoimidazolesuccinocarboxamide synthase [Halalkalibacillus halophilus]